MRMARALRAYEHRYRLRLAKIPVDAVAERLEIAAVTVNPLGDSPEAKEDPLTQTSRMRSATSTTWTWPRARSCSTPASTATPS